MPCSDSSSSITIYLDSDERFICFEYAKITCGQEISANTGLNRYFVGSHLDDILNSSFNSLVKDLNVLEEENQFVLYMEWDALRSAVGNYLGREDAEIDTERSMVTSINHNEKGIEIALVILPPKEIPKILPCRLGEQNRSDYYKKMIN